jgi:predicted nucleic acid-binding protein
MTRIVIDASVVLKWYFSEPFSEEALRLANSNFEIYVPETIFLQVGNVLWKRVRSGDLKKDDAHVVLSNLHRLPFTKVSPNDLASSALEISTLTTRTFNESLYFALAIREKTVLVTADRWWYSLLQTGPMKNHIKWVGDLKKS